MLGVNPATLEVSDFFDMCYPTLTKGEIDSELAGRGIWDKLTQMGPESQQRENVETFDTRLKSGLNKLVEASSKVSPGKRRNVLAGMALDQNRFADQHAFYRVILYTKGALIDPSIVEGPLSQMMQSTAERYATSFSGADVYVYGVAGDELGRPLETATKLFSSFFLNSWGMQRSFSPSLPQQKAGIFQPAHMLSGTFEGGGTKGAVKIKFTTGAGPDLAQAWLTFVVGTTSLYVPFQGEYTCDFEHVQADWHGNGERSCMVAIPLFAEGRHAAFNWQGAR